PCPRNGTQYVAPQNQPAAAWELASQPHEARSTTINIFLQTLTAYDLQHDISRCGGVLLSAHQASYGGGSETLSEIAQRCIRTANSTAVFHLHFIVALITLSFKCASLSNWKESVNLAALHREHLSQDANSPSVRTLQYWYAGGSKLISLAAGGSFYMLLWLAYTDLRTPFIEADGNIAYDLANILRNPNSESSAGRLVQSTIIPTLAFLSQQCPVKLGEFFSTNLLSELAISAETLCSDLSTSDRLFDALPSNSFRALPRSSLAWAAFQSLAQPAFKLTVPLLTTQVTCVTSLFDPQQATNRQCVASSDRQKNSRWTEIQREFAKDAVEPSTVDGLRRLVSCILRTAGVVLTALILYDVLTVHSCHGDIFASICKSMEQSMRDRLIDRLADCFEPDALKVIDTAQERGDHVFQALHFSWYNRHCMTGHNAPPDVPPMNLKRTGGLKTNYHQMIPYPSKDMANSTNVSIYQSVKKILGPVFEWLDMKFKAMIPDVYERLDAYASILPGNNQAVSAPFLGLVINLNVSTAAHRDSKDDSMCLHLESVKTLYKPM
ncbi:uncharacterized protein C8Q71DRAFT_711403, partial [Rhodofomes roseus]